MRKKDTAPAAAAPGTDAARTLYQLKISLDNVRPSVWRRVVVRGDMTLDVLSDVRQCVMGWDGWHGHAFTINKTTYGDTESWGDDRMERDYTVADVVSKAGTQFRYEYDFGDSWIHTITAEKISTPSTPMKELARCTGGKNASPPEDCGGPYGYYEMLRAIRNPRHPQHEEMLEWLGDGFDPAEFSHEAADIELKALLRRSGHGKRR